jgi:hypothetical protein
MDTSLFKKHPVILGAVVLIGGLFVYLAIKSGKQSAPSSPDISTDIANAQAAQAITANQYGAQLQIAGISAQVSAYQAQAELAAVQARTAGDVAIATAQASRDLGIATVSADAQTQQTRIVADAKRDIASDYFHTSLEAINSQVDLDREIELHKFEITQNVISQAGKDKSRSSTGWAQIFSALQGRGPEAIAANQPSEVASSPANIISSIGKTISSFF